MPPDATAESRLTAAFPADQDATREPLAALSNQLSAWRPGREHALRVLRRPGSSPQPPSPPDADAPGMLMLSAKRLQSKTRVSPALKPTATAIPPVPFSGARVVY